LGATAWLSDGSEAVFGPVQGLGGRAAKIASFVRDLAIQNRDEIEANWPKVMRRVAGYNLDIFDNQNERPYSNDDGVNLAHLLVGSEGTLAFTKDLTLKLVPLPKNKVLGVVNFASFPAAMDSAQHIVKLGPSAVELVDRIMIELALSNPVFRPTMESALIGKPDAILLVEFSGDDKPALLRKLADLVALMGDLGLPGSVVEMQADAPQKNLWEVRKAGLNIMMSLKGDGKPVSFIEDCAVPLESLAEYTDALTEVFARHTMGVTENDLTVSVPKLFFGYATGTNLLFPFAVGGATALFAERSTPEKMFEVIERYRPTILTTVPTMINAMLNAEDARARDISSIRFCYSAGEALPVEIYHRWKETFGVEICDGIGSAEMFHIYITNRPGDVEPGTLGRIVDGYEARIVDEAGNELPTGKMGTLRIKGDSAALCYWNAHEKSKETFAGDWCTSGDQFHVDENGYYWYHGRTDDMLKVSGVFVAPAEIENCLLQHEAVLECAVVGHDDGDGLVKPKAFVVLREGLEPLESVADEIKEFVKSKIALYKYPRWIEFVPSLPKNDRGKIDRKLLKT